MIFLHKFYSDSKELQSWIDTINSVCAAFSAQPLAGGVGSQRKFQRPLLPCSHTKLSLVSFHYIYVKFIIYSFFYLNTLNKLM